MQCDVFSRLRYRNVQHDLAYPELQSVVKDLPFAGRPSYPDDGMLWLQDAPDTLLLGLSGEDNGVTMLTSSIPATSFTMGYEDAVYLAKLAEQAERYEGPYPRYS
jgi:hypothetical protein